MSVLHRAGFHTSIVMLEESNQGEQEFTHKSAKKREPLGCLVLLIFVSIHGVSIVFPHSTTMVETIEKLEQGHFNGEFIFLSLSVDRLGGRF